MTKAPKPDEVAAALAVSIGFLRRQLRQPSPPGGLTLPETSALARLGRGGAGTSREPAKRGPSSAQSRGATLGARDSRGLIERLSDPADGRRAVLSVTEAGLHVLRE